jgi:hypothetical protein
MTIEARPVRVATDATSLVVVHAGPLKAVYWSLQGNGTLTPLSDSTDESGVAAARIAPTGAAGEQLIVTASYGE